MVPTKWFCTIAVLIGLCLVFITVTEAAPPASNAYYNDFEETPEDVLMELIARFGQTIMRARNDLENPPKTSSSKRTVDFGMGRGYSGTKEAQYRIGLQAAEFPGGPGRRRRSETQA